MFYAEIMYKLCHTEIFNEQVKSETLIRALEGASETYMRAVSIQRKPGRVDYDPTKKKAWRFKETQYGLECNFKLPNSTLLVKAIPLARRDNPWEKGFGREELYRGLRFYREDHANPRTTGQFAREVSRYVRESYSDLDIPF